MNPPQLPPPPPLPPPPRSLPPPPPRLPPPPPLPQLPPPPQLPLPPPPQLPLPPPPQLPLPPPPQLPPPQQLPPPPPLPLPPQLPPPQQLPPPPKNHLTTTLSSLTNLLTFSNQILSTIPHPQTLTTNFIPCPFNPNHLVPPPSLFLHHLRCPNSPRLLPNPDHLLYSLTYPKTFQNPNSNNLASYFNFTSNFFYTDCPGVVTFSDANDVAKNAAFNLPVFLSLECSDDNNMKTTVRSSSPNHKPSPIVPSQYFSISREIESWNQFPVTFSNSVFRAILGIGIAKESEMVNWLIPNSPRYGVVIDKPMEKHIFLLFCLCFKSIFRDRSSLSNALVWLDSQVSILYGVNGKLFVLNFLKKCILVGASGLLLFPLGNEVADSVSSKQERNNTDCIRERKISMPQVVAAVAALYERSVLERKIKGFWFSQPSNNYQLVSEHRYLSDKANEERKNRADYRPIIEYDWVHRQHSTHQETQKEKTREELLAEERDYKRRRMSYRGKRRNTSTLQVMRDLINFHMEEIKLAAGVKSPVSVPEASLMPPPKLPSSHDIPMEANTSRKVSQDSPAVSISNPGYHEQQSHKNYSDKSKAVHDDSSEDFEQRKQGHHRSHHNGGDQQTTDQGNHWSRASTSPERQRCHSRSHEHSYHHKKKDYSNRKKYDNSSRTKDRWQKDTHKNHFSDSFSRNEFSERYEPLKPRDVGEHDVSPDDKDIKPDKFYWK